MMVLPAIVVVSLLGTLFAHISVDSCLHGMVCASTYFCNHIIYTFVICVSSEECLQKLWSQCDKGKHFCVYFVPILIAHTQS